MVQELSVGLARKLSQRSCGTQEVTIVGVEVRLEWMCACVTVKGGDYPLHFHGGCHPSAFVGGVGFFKDLSKIRFSTLLTLMNANLQKLWCEASRANSCIHVRPVKAVLELRTRKDLY